MRNSNSAHNDKEFHVDIRSMNVDDFIENLFITKLMVTILAEEEFENGKKKNKRNNTRQHVQKNFDPVLVEVTEQHQAAQSEIDIEEYMILKNA